ncbi:MAG: DnaJ domain-containing protein [Flavobacteriaceae bacterium]|nr:DnaJ domain-containing protein [Flavobacteriaceae bacterium]
MKDYYNILNISRNAQEVDIKKAYRKLAMVWHPDINNSPFAHSKFIEINEAYEILINPIKRDQYDKLFAENREVEISTEFKQWQDSAQRKAETYAKMDSEEFKSKILSELKLAGKYGVSFGCFTFLILGFVANLIYGFIMPFAFFSAFIFGIGMIYFYNISIKGYFEERKDL